MNPYFDWLTLKVTSISLIADISGFHCNISRAALPQRRHEKLCAWPSDVTRLTHGWHNGCCVVLTGGLSKFSGIIHKVTDSSSPEHCSVCTCMLARRRKDAKHWKAAVNMPHALSNTHLMYNHLGSLKKQLNMLELGWIVGQECLPGFRQN